MMPRRMDALVLPGKFLVGKFAELKKQQQEQRRRKITERELAHLHHKIDKLLIRLEENEPEPAMSQDEECAICISAKATMQTFPCGHRVVCRKCFVKTIQMAVSQRLLPLRCVICRAKILRLKQLSSGRHRDADHPNYHSVTETMPRTLSSAFRDHIPGNPGFAKITKVTGYAKLPGSSPSSAPGTAENRRAVHRPAGKRSGMPLPPPAGTNSSRSSFSRRNFSSKSTFLLPIPELEELKIVGSEEKNSLSADFGSAVWAMQNDFGKKEKKEKKPKKVGAEINNEDFAKWWAKIRQFRPPSIVKMIRNRWKQH